MEDVIKLEFTLEGVFCSSCMTKIENRISKIDGVHSAKIDFVKSKLFIEVFSTYKRKIDRIKEEAQKIAKTIEPGLKVFEVNDRHSDLHDAHDDHTHDHIHSMTLSTGKKIQYGVGLSLFIFTISLDMFFWLELFLFITSYLLIGGEIVWRAIKNILHGQVFDENFLMALATLGAFAIQEFPEAVAVMIFYQVGEFFQGMAISRSRKSISDLMDIRPDYANLKIDGTIKKVSPEEVHIGNTILVKPGEKLPLDGKIIDGESMVDTSALTGESVPRVVRTGDRVLSGSINKNRTLTIEVTKEFSDSTVAKILDLVENASLHKAPTENFITKFAKYYTPIVVISALLLAFIPPLLIDGASLSQWVYRALVFLVISCPCALVISIPLGFFGGIGRASKSGVLVKGGNYLEALNKVETIVFDKTGTLTKGIFKVTEIHAIELPENEFLEFVAIAESHSNHPIASSILEAYQQPVNDKDLVGFEEIAGHGIKASVRGREVLAGNVKLMQSENIPFNEVDTIGTILRVAIDKKYAGYIVITDQIKDDAKHALTGLKHLGINKLVMLTGDHRNVATKVSDELGLDEVYYELLPDQKVEEMQRIENERTSKRLILFVGDGINDAPVLARADIGVAMGGVGSDAAVEAADIVLMTDEPSKLTDAIKISKFTKKIVVQNIVFALGIKGFILLLGAFGITSMWEAVFADVGVALLAVFNAMRVLKYKI